VDAIIAIHSVKRLDKLALMAENLVPRPAATVLTLRDAPNGYEILMLRRNVRSEFMAASSFFPAAAVDNEDASAPVYGLNDDVASQRLGLERGGLAFYVASLRELFEEAGLLIVCDDEGREFRFTTPEELVRLASYRRALNAGEVTLADVLGREDVCLDLRGVAYLAHWITPVGPPRRYDTRFFVVLAPEGQPATHDANETVAERWMRPPTRSRHSNVGSSTWSRRPSRISKRSRTFRRRARYWTSHAPSARSRRSNLASSNATGHRHRHPR